MNSNEQKNILFDRSWRLCELPPPRLVMSTTRTGKFTECAHVKYLPFPSLSIIVLWFWCSSLLQLAYYQKQCPLLEARH